MPRLKPPANMPQDTPALFSRSPMFLPVIWTVFGGGRANVVGGVLVTDEGEAALAASATTPLAGARAERR